MMEDVRSGLHITEVLKCMRDYLYGVHLNSHVGGHIAYCDSCEAIVLVSDDYSRHAGRNMSRKKQREQCFHCDGTDFVELSYKDMHDLRGKYGERSPKIIIEGIEAGLRKVKLIGRGYTLYGKDFTEIFETWIALSEDEKRRQILSLFQRIDELLEAEKIVERAMENVHSLEESL